jgi:TonB family protein
MSAGPALFQAESRYTCGMRYSLFVIAMSFAFAQAPEPVDAQGWIDKGLELNKTGKHAEAVQALESALRIDPQHMFALHTLAWIQFNQKAFDDARGTYERILQVEPHRKEAHYGLAAISAARVEEGRLEARKKSGMKTKGPGPIREPEHRMEFQNRFGPMIEDGIRHLEIALQQDPQWAPAVAYMTQLIAARAEYANDVEAYQREIASSNEWAAKMPAREAAQQIRAGNEVQSVKLVKDVPPVYPPLASQARIQGTVRFNVVIDANGRVKNPVLVSGHPLLVEAAAAALKQREYQPTLLNGKPVEVVTQADVNFKLPR